MSDELAALREANTALAERAEGLVPLAHCMLDILDDYEPEERREEQRLAICVVHGLLDRDGNDTPVTTAARALLAVTLSPSNHPLPPAEPT